MSAPGAEIYPSRGRPDPKNPLKAKVNVGWFPTADGPGTYYSVTHKKHIDRIKAGETDLRVILSDDEVRSIRFPTKCTKAVLANQNVVQPGQDFVPMHPDVYVELVEKTKAEAQQKAREKAARKRKRRASVDCNQVRERKKATPAATQQCVNEWKGYPALYDLAASLGPDALAELRSLVTEHGPAAALDGFYPQHWCRAMSNFCETRRLVAEPVAPDRRRLMRNSLLLGLHLTLRVFSNMPRVPIALPDYDVDERNPLVDFIAHDGLDDAEGWVKLLEHARLPAGNADAADPYAAATMLGMFIATFCYVQP